MAGRRKKPAQLRIVRLSVLAFFIVLVTFLAVMHQRSVPGFGPVDALCPFGGIEALYKFLAGGGYISKTFASNFVLLGGIVIIGIFLGRYFCGWICMFGGLQEFFGILGKKIFGKRFIVPSKIDAPLRYLKYVILVGVLALTWKTGELIIRPYDPFVAYSHIAAGFRSMWDEFAIGFIVLAVTMIASMFYDRVFCKYLCPLGAFLAAFNKTGIYKIRREVATCTNCRICDKSCALNIHVSVQKAVTSGECINCLECVNDCPTKKKSLLPVVFKRDISAVTVAVLGIAIYAVTIGASKVTGIWESSNATLIEISEEGALTPEEIKGSNSLKEVADVFRLEIADLYNELELDPAVVPEDTKIKDIKYLTGADSFEAEVVRAAVAKMLGLPVAEPELQEQTDETVVIPAAPVSERAVSEPEVDKSEPGSAATVTTVPAFTLEGTMSVKDVAEALKISEEEVIEKLGLPADIPRGTPLREMREQYGYTMPELKQRIE